MLKRALSKVMWVGRATVFIVGLAVIVGAIVGVSGMALAANGKPFILGQKNVASKASRLVGKVAGPSLRINNASTDRRATALMLHVRDGKPPMKVDSSEKVRRLNADQIDGKTSTDFYAAGSKVEDSKHADQADSATSAEQATSAQNAANADKLGGDPASAFARAYEQTVVVSPVGTPQENGTALKDALFGITDASADKPYLLKIEPGVYDVGTNSLQMKPFVDMEGSGQGVTRITGSGTGGPGSFSATLAGANDAELRLLTVENAGGDSQNAVGIFNDGVAPRLKDVTVKVTEQANVPGFGDWNIGIDSSGQPSPTTMEGVRVIVSGSPDQNAGLRASSALIEVRNSHIEASGGQSFGLFVDDGTPNHTVTVDGSRIAGSDSSIQAASAVTILVGASELAGGPAQSPGTVTCAGVYDENYTFFASTCP